MWRRVIVLPLCVCLLAAMQHAHCYRESGPVRQGFGDRAACAICSAANESMPSFTDGSYLEGRVQEIQDGPPEGRHQEDQPTPIRCRVDFRAFPRIGSPPCSSPGIKGTRESFSVWGFSWAATG